MPPIAKPILSIFRRCTCGTCSDGLAYKRCRAIRQDEYLLRVAGGGMIEITPASHDNVSDTSYAPTYSSLVISWSHSDEICTRCLT